MKLLWRGLVGASILAIVVHRTGRGPFVTGVSALDAQTLLLGSGLAAVTTGACAWRWHLVATELGVAIRPRTAVAACYRSQFLNTVLPGGVLGDVHRGVMHGRSARATGRALRAVGWERFAGQVVQAAVAVVVLLVLPSPVGPLVPWAVALVGVLLLAVALVAGRISGAGSSRWHRVVRVIRHDVRFALLGRRSWPGIVAASAVAVTGHVAMYVLAVRAVGITAPLSTVLPLAVLVLVAAGLPLNLAGWGPREGMAAWAFAAAGLGAGPGVAAAVAFGAMGFVATLPGLVVLLAVRERCAEPQAVAGRSPVQRPEIIAGGATRA